jgi:hypothetical protein
MHDGQLIAVHTRPDDAFDEEIVLVVVAEPDAGRAAKIAAQVFCAHDHAVEAWGKVRATTLERYALEPGECSTVKGWGFCRHRDPSAK